MTETRRYLQTADGTTISYTVLSGADPAAVILHGLAGSGRELLPTARALAGRRVILIDQRGHGLSTRNPTDTSREAFVEDVVNVIGTETTSPVDLIGQSMGAHTAMLVAAARTDLVRKLVLLEGNEGSGAPDEHAAIGDYFRSWKVPFPDRQAALDALGDSPLTRAWVDDMVKDADGLRPRFDADVMQSAIEAVGRPRWAEWERVAAPTLAVYADGGMFTEEQKTRFVDRGHDVTRVDLVGASHDAHLDAFDAWVEALTAFLRAP